MSTANTRCRSHAHGPSTTTRNHYRAEPRPCTHPPRRAFAHAPEQRAKLAGIQVGETTLLELFDAWLNAGHDSIRGLLWALEADETLAPPRRSKRRHERANALLKPLAAPNERARVG